MDQGEKSKSERLTGEEVVDQGKKSKSEIDERLRPIKEAFNKEYQDTFLEKPSGSFPKLGSFSKSDNLSSHGNSSATGDSTSDSKRGRPKASRVETKSELPGQTVHGFKNEVLFLKNFLLKQKESEKFKTLAVVGKYGVGKTTLCQVVFNDKDVKPVYLPRVWVSMYSQEQEEDEDPKIAVVKRILTSLGVEDEVLKDIKTDVEEEKRTKEEAGVNVDEEVKDKEAKELSRLLYVLNSKLIGKKYLIVLDDVWEDNEWDQRLDDAKNQNDKSHLSCGFPKELGGRVILTSRDETVAKKIVGEEEKQLLRLYPRTDAGSVMEIYKDAAKEALGIDVIPRYPGRFKQELMDKSCGVPLAARMLAKIEPEKVDEAGEMDKK